MQSVKTGHGPNRSFRKLFRKLAWVHWTHAVLLFQLLGTGAFLYFPRLRTGFVEYHMLIRSWHLVVSLLYVLILVASIPWIVQYVRQIHRRIGKRVHIGLVFTAMILWTVSGIVMWRIHDFPSSWRAPATILHDWLSVLAVPWITVHVLWIIVRKRLGSHVRKVVKVIGARMGLERKPHTGSDINPRPGSISNELHLSRRQWLIGLGAALGSLAAGGITKWYWPILQPLEADVPKRKGQFRLYNVSPQVPKPALGEYRLQVDGLVGQPMQFSLAELQSHPQISIIRDFHCITGWSVTNVEWAGVPLSYILQQVKPLADAKYMTVYSLDGLYTDSYTLEQFSEVDVLLALRMDGAELPAVHGAPCRIMFPKLYGYKSVKWVSRIELTAERHTGYWELRGYDLNGELPA